jgi:hypothetical protein
MVHRDPSAATKQKVYAYDTTKSTAKQWRVTLPSDPYDGSCTTGRPSEGSRTSVRNGGSRALNRGPDSGVGAEARIGSCVRRRPDSKGARRAPSMWTPFAMKRLVRSMVSATDLLLNLVMTEDDALQDQDSFLRRDFVGTKQPDCSIRVPAGQKDRLAAVVDRSVRRRKRRASVFRVETAGDEFRVPVPSTRL